MTAIIDSPLTHCRSCTSLVAPWDRFCTKCGTKAEPGSVADDAAYRHAGDTDPRGFAPINAPSPPVPPSFPPTGADSWYSRRGTRFTAIALAAALAVGFGATGIHAYVDNQQHQQLVDGLLSTATQSLEQNSAKLAQVTTTAQVRSIAAEAAHDDTLLTTGTPAIEGRDGTRASSLHSALRAIAALTVLDTDTLDQWPALRGSLKPAFDAVSNNDGVIGVPGSDRSLAAVDGLVTKGTQALAKWNSRNAASKAKQASDLAALDAYSTRMESLLTQYAAMRLDTHNQLDAIRDAGFYDTASARAMFDSALRDRTVVRDGMNGLSVPKGLGAQHSDVASVVSDGMSSMNHLVSAITANAATCAYTSCNLLEEPSWDEFQRTSEKVGDNFDSAVSSWRAGASERHDAIKHRQMPGKPTV